MSHVSNSSYRIDSGLRLESGKDDMCLVPIWPDFYLEKDFFSHAIIDRNLTRVSDFVKKIILVPKKQIIHVQVKLLETSVEVLYGCRSASKTPASIV